MLSSPGRPTRPRPSALRARLPAVRTAECDSALWRACADGDSAIVHELLDNGADIDAQDQGGYTPLMNAAAFGRDGVVMLLKSAGCNEDLRDREGRTAADWAEAKSQRSTFILLSEGASTRTSRERSRRKNERGCIKSFSIKMQRKREWFHSPPVFSTPS